MIDEIFKREYEQAPTTVHRPREVEGERKVLPHIAPFWPSFFRTPEHTAKLVNEVGKLDAVVVFEGNTVVKKRAIKGREVTLVRPTGSYDKDDYGSLGGRWRSLAMAYITARLGSTPRPVFVGGNPEKKIQSHTGHRHSGAEVMKERYVRDLGKIHVAEQGNLDEKFIALDKQGGLREISILDTSENSAADVLHVLQTAHKKSWRKVGFLSNHYHLPRLLALVEWVKERHPQLEDIEVIPIGAEDTILSLARETMQDEYEKIFVDFYMQPDMGLRIRSEKNGIADLQMDNYDAEREGKPANGSVK